MGDTVTVAYERDDPEWVYDPVEFPLPGDGTDTDEAGGEAGGEAAGDDGTGVTAWLIAGGALVAAVLVGGLTVAWTLSAPRRAAEAPPGGPLAPYSWAPGYPYPVPSYPVPSYPVPSYPVPSYPVPSYPAPSYPAPPPGTPDAPGAVGAAPPGTSAPPPGGWGAPR
ncbi:MAG: hypothetical protein ACFCVG_13745 [Kineosporiaceae bacterium]